MATSGRLFKALQETLEVVDVNDFINHIYNFRDTYKKENMQDMIIQKIIEDTCEKIGIPKYDVLNTKYTHGGKRIQATGIIGFLIKSYFPQLSYSRICVELKNNVDQSNLQRYVKSYKDLNPEGTKYDKEMYETIETLNLQILNFIKNEKLRIEKQCREETGK